MFVAGTVAAKTSFLSVPLASFHSLHKLPSPPLMPYSPDFSPHPSFSQPSCPPTVSVVFHTASTPISSLLFELLIDFFSHPALPLIFFCLCFSPAHHQLNKPSLLPSASPIINTFGLRAFMYVSFWSTLRARGHANTRASVYSARFVPVLMHGNSLEM